MRKFLFWDGIVKLGAPFAFVMKVIGMLVLRGEGQTLGQYVTSSTTWTAFFLNATAFGLAMGFVNWRRNEKAYFESPAARGQNENS